MENNGSGIFTMDALDEQLAQLKLLNNRSLSPKISESGVGGGGGGGGQGGGGQGQSSSPVHTLYKKVGPAVPPKPLKKNISPPQIVSKQPSDQQQQQQQSKILGSSGIPVPRKLNHLYSNMKMTLDNPVILDQQLEALEHHKKQMQKKSGVVVVPPPHFGSYSSGGSGGGGGNFDDILGTSSGVSNNFHVYSNLEPPNSNSSPDVIVYSNIRHQSQDSDGGNSRSGGSVGGIENIVYSNVGFDELPPPPPLDIPPVPLNLTIGGPVVSSNFDYLHQTSEEDLPPPPSPVSSSYSELRRATDNFPQMPQYPIYNSNGTVSSVGGAGGSGGGGGSSGGGNNGQQQSQQHQQQHQQQQQPTTGSKHGGIGSASGNISGSSSNLDDDLHHLQQTYVNTQYQNDYNAYEPSSRSLSNSSSDYYGYGDLSQSSSTYESIYEPINPRPPSQLSSRSNYSLYTSYVNGSQGTGTGSNTPSIVGGGNIPSSNSSNGVGGGSTVGGGGSSSGGGGGSSSKLPSHKEAEVEALTNLLVHSMDGGSDVDNYGICVKCGERVVGESSGCTAMEQIYHIVCFTCSQCQINLQGKPFYALEGKPYCEEDYLNTLEKCSVCMKPILERILRATGKPFHPGCFCCVVCGNSLDGIPFTVDATNQNYCIEDFHKKFAPRCCVCRQPIMPEPGQEETVRVVALDRSFHFECYKCEDCGLLLSSEAEGRGCYPLDDHVLCKSCNAKRVQALTSRMTTEL